MIKTPFKKHKTIKAIGLMSGTSLDGLDIAAVEFRFAGNRWIYHLLEAETIAYPKIWKNRLETAPQLSKNELTLLNTKYGSYLGEQIQKFIQKTKFAPDLIASHGHTIFHRPDLGYTLQIGNGATIASATNTITVADFRSLDVAKGGQGAPLVPIGDRLLFGEYDYCLNLGGFANISFEQDGLRRAFDVCPVNIVLNQFAEKLGKPFDKNGDLGKLGKLHKNVLDKLNALPYYRQLAPKSLGREWMEETFLPVIQAQQINEYDILRTVYEHIAIQLTNSVSGTGKMLITGGGAFNSFLIERIKNYTSTQLVLPDPNLINFKEALVFAFMGVLRMLEEKNCLASATGAKSDSCCGEVFAP
ncbi:anhydro-N-acetylmuramic acid kinase [uncultured Draconibacterium sp.]|uniref:anhydro-N-acetylmuramic acid kinase n=1 Tax=uncultured Draconibacterium sp. TaxID=1573823 RepID=UPI0025E66A02|nr:anhydro-N-acetylmuramic acid kinase [uncultured Draconibacterium sp.]